MMDRGYPAAVTMSLSGILAWLVPGLGHYIIGERRRGLIFFVTISATFWTGVAVGGAGSTVYPEERKLWFAAQLFAGTETLVAYGLHSQVIKNAPTYKGKPFLGHWASSEVGVHYTGVAGLLNLLVILDAIARADPNSTRQRELERPLRGEA